jgi:hypothetical protein
MYPPILYPALNALGAGSYTFVLHLLWHGLMLPRSLNFSSPCHNSAWFWFVWPGFNFSAFKMMRKIAFFENNGYSSVLVFLFEMLTWIRFLKAGKERAALKKYFFFKKINKGEGLRFNSSNIHSLKCSPSCSLEWIWHVRVLKAEFLAAQPRFCLIFPSYKSLVLLILYSRYHTLTTHTI